MRRSKRLTRKQRRTRTQLVLAAVAGALISFQAGFWTHSPKQGPLHCVSVRIKGDKNSLMDFDPNEKYVLLLQNPIEVQCLDKPVFDEPSFGPRAER